jgi:uncharacterized protein (TIGR00299 family) protein
MHESEPQRHRALIFDPFAGISGDMLLGALVDLGLSPDWLRSLVDSVGVDVTVEVEGASRSGIACHRVRFRLPPERSHRHLSDVLALVHGSAATDAAKRRAEAVFRRIAEAEAAVHGVAVEAVHFHEVGALDSVLDVLCGVAGVAELGYDRFYTRPVAVGSGTVEIAHGAYPLPAPATARLLNGLPVRETAYPEECTTPTGAALLAELTGGRRTPAEVMYGRSGYGAGERDPEGRPNCLRLIECTTAADASVLVVQADVDDQSPEYVAAARDALMEAGALDVTLARVDMKKGRPGLRLEALVPEPSLDEVLAALFRGTTTIGARYWPVQRRTLDRTEDRVTWRGHAIRVKRARLPDGGTRAKPEFDDVREAARATGLTPHEVRAQLELDEERGERPAVNDEERSQSHE